MLKVAQEVNIPNYSKLQPSENAGNDFTPTSNSKIRFNIDGNQFPMISPHNSYLEFDIEATDNNCKVEFNKSKQGCNVVIKSLKCYVNNVIVEDIDNYNDLAHMCAEYGQTDDERNLSAVFDHNVGKQGLLCTGVANPPVNNKIKCVTQLKESGLWGNDTALPVMAFESIQVEIELEDAVKVLKRQCLASYKVEDIVVPAGGNILAVVMSPNLCPYNAAQVIASPRYDTFSDLNNFPLTAGDRITLKTKRGDTGAVEDFTNQTITGVTVNADGNIEIACSIAGTATRSHRDCTIEPTLGSDGNAIASSYKITNPQLAIRTLEVPPQMAQSMLGRMEAGALFYDIKTYSCYKTTNPAAQAFNTITIPCRSNRGLGMLAKGKGANQANTLSIAGYNWDGEYNDLKQYQFQYGEERRPDRPVNLNSMLFAERYASQEHIKELEAALKDSGCHANDLRKHYENFVIGRGMSYKGSSEDLSGIEVLLYIEYNAAGGTTSKLWTSFCHHIRRIQADPNGFHQVVY
tara:strand:+ start:100 stop:1656 length:1557 start_codon:yes stop_codon:yes gene_type:complete